MRAFKRFVARRGTPTVIFSDNGRTFKGASEEVKEFVSFLCQEFAHPGVKWKFSVELAPWWGGFWERLVRSVKEPLRKVLGRQVIGYDELVTTVTEVEAVADLWVTCTWTAHQIVYRLLQRTWLMGGDYWDQQYRYQLKRRRILTDVSSF